MQAFIDDGYNRTVGLKEIPNIRAGVEFTYRPLAGTEASKIKGAWVRGDEDAGEKVLAMMADRISSWNLPRPVEVENLRKLQEPVFSAMLNILLGYQAPDYEVEPSGETNDAPLSDQDQQGEDEKN